VVFVFLYQMSVRATQELRYSSLERNILRQLWTYVFGLKCFVPAPL